MLQNNKIYCNNKSDEKSYSLKMGVSINKTGK